MIGAIGCGGEQPLTGSLRVAGSTTAQPIVSLLIGAVIEQSPSLRVAIEANGTGAGILALCERRADIAMASRAMNERERQRCDDNSIAYADVPFAIDAVVVATGKGGPVDCLSTTQLYALAGPESVGFDNWSQASQRSVELGGTTLPSAPLTFVAPSVGSVTSAVFADLVIADLAAREGQLSELRADVTPVSSDLLVAEQLHRQPTWLGLLGLTASTGAGDRIAPVAIDGGAGCVAPTAANVADRSYPLSRTLHLYVVTGNGERSRAAAAVVDQALGNDASDFVTNAGAVPLSPDARRQALDNWTRASQ